MTPVQEAAAATSGIALLALIAEAGGRAADRDLNALLPEFLAQSP